MKDSIKRSDIAHEVVCNAIASLNEQLKQENMELSIDTINVLKFDLELKIRQTLKKAKVNKKVSYFSNGKKCEEYFNALGKLHNENGPAYIIYDENGNKSSERYYINGLFHNPKGPAYINSYPNTHVQYKEYWLHGQQISVFSDEQFIKYVQLIEPK